MATAVGAAEPKVSGSPVTARAVAFVAERRPAAEALGKRSPTSSTTPMPSPTRAAGFRELADPEYLAGTQRIAPGIGRLYGVRWPLTAAVERGFRTATRRERATGYLEIATRLYAEPSSSRAGSRSASSTGSCPTTPSAPGSSSAGSPARPTTGSRSTPWPIPSDAASCPSRTAGPSSRARLLAVALGTPARRLDGRHDAVRGPSARPGARDRGARPGPRRGADRRRRAGRPEGAVMGAPVARPGRPGRGRCVRRAPDRAGRGRRRRPPGLGAAGHPGQAARRRCAAIRAGSTASAGGPARRPRRGRRDRRPICGSPGLPGPAAHRDRFPDPLCDPGEARP